MPPNPNSAGWRGVGLIAITYIYFLIFAQFAFLNRLAVLGITDAHLKAVMAAMASGGILLSVLTPRLTFCSEPRLRLRTGFATCGAAACLTVLPLGPAASMAVSFFIGSGLGLLTVTLVTYLPLWLGNHNPLLNVGLGTGLGYLVCNVPLLFTASPQVQAVTAAALCFAGIFLSLKRTTARPPQVVASTSSLSFSVVLVSFTALVWLDSAAFFIVQNTPALKASTWGGPTHLWTNGLLHLVGALASAWFLRRRGLSGVLALAFLVLASACLLLLDPQRAVLASIFYPVGVSLYSVALVAYPSLLAPASSAAERGRQAGWIYAIAGWFGSAMGIGMGQNLGYIPPAFVLLAAGLIFMPQILKFLPRRKREVVATIAILGAALVIDRAVNTVQASHPIVSQGERGRQVYISEGCISCHSQYVRPNTSDVLLWGPAQPLEDLRREHPPLIGNRRQGPDLAQVGSRRSALWLKAHLFSPSELSHASFMPTYAYLFADDRGDDLVSYLRSLRASGFDPHPDAKVAWRPSPAALAQADARDGKLLFDIHCATCHDVEGRTRRVWRKSFGRLPPDLVHGPLLHIPELDLGTEFQSDLARIVKFGIPGTDMPGHEYLPDQEITSIVVWLARNIAQPGRNQQINLITGEK